MKHYLTLDDMDVKGRKVLVRVDINSPIEDGKVAATDRIEAAAETLDALAARGAAVVVLAHQGRKDGPDFTSLAGHAEVLKNFVSHPVSFVDDVAGEKALGAIDALKGGEVLVLDNVRGLDDEMLRGSPDAMSQVAYVRALSGAVDLFVNDAFPAAHRDQPSIVGFPHVLPAAAGRLMDRELTALGRATRDPRHPTVYVLGGAKVDDAIAVMEHNFASGALDAALVGGLVGELFLVAQGVDLGAPKMTFLEERGVLEFVEDAKRVLAAHGDRIVTPVDVAVRTDAGRVNVAVDDLPAEGTILDVGPETVALYGEHIAKAESLLMNGPLGLYEEAPFGEGTQGVLRAFRESAAFSVLGGGHTVSAIHKFGFTFDDFGYVSLAGGALMAFLTGKELPAVAAMEASKRSFRAMKVA